MAARTITFEKQGRRVVFHRADLDAYRAKHRIYSKDDNHTRPSKVFSLAASGSDAIPACRPSTMLALDAVEIIKEITAAADAAHRLTRESAQKLLMAIRGDSLEKAEGVLTDYQQACVRAFSQLRSANPEKAVMRMDWSFAVAGCFLDFVEELKRWELSGQDATAHIRLISPLEPVVSYSERMLPCVQVIPQDEFAKAIEDTHEFFCTPHRFDKTGTNGDELIPTNVVLRRSPDSVNREPASFVGPMTSEDRPHDAAASFRHIESGRHNTGKRLELAKHCKTALAA